MQTWVDLERAQQAAIKRTEEQRVLNCKCGCSWFETVNCKQFQADHSVIIGQEVPERKGLIPFKLLRCVKCSEIYEPRIYRSFGEPGGRDYDAFVKELSETTPKAEKV